MRPAHLSAILTESVAVVGAELYSSSGPLHPATDVYAAETRLWLVIISDSLCISGSDGHLYWAEGIDLDVKVPQTFNAFPVKPRSDFRRVSRRGPMERDERLA